MPFHESPRGSAARSSEVMTDAVDNHTWWRGRRLSTFRQIAASGEALMSVPNPIPLAPRPRPPNTSSFHSITVCTILMSSVSVTIQWPPLYGVRILGGEPP